MLNYLVMIFLTLSGIFCKHPQKPNPDRFAKSEISLEKTECYGTCPVYSITIYGTGKVLYEGKRFVKKEGKYEKQLSQRQTSKIFNAFECASFFDFNSEYTAGISDLPTTYVTFQHRGFKKKITDYYGGPDELKKLEKMVEDIAMSDEGWSKIE
jgi:hypothetical protein